MSDEPPMADQEAPERSGPPDAPEPRAVTCSVDRGGLFQRLRALPPGLLRQLIFLLNAPPGVIRGEGAPQTERVGDLLAWAEGTGGCTLARVEEELGNLPASSAEERRQTLRAYAERLIRSRYGRMSTGGLYADTPTGATQIREPMLDDTFVEPSLIRAGSLRESHEEVDRLLEAVHDEEAEASSRDAARLRLLQLLLQLQSETWQKIWKGGGTRPADAMLAEHRAAVVLGDPGGGKSTLIRWLLITEAKKILSSDAQGAVPLLVAVGDYANAWDGARAQGRDLPLDEFLRARAQSECPGMEAVIAAALAPGGAGVLLLLDGLDEVPRELRQGVVPRIQAFIDARVGEDRPQRVIVCSRFFGYEEAPIVDPVVQLALTPFTDDQIRAFAGKWHAWVERFLYRDQADPENARADAALFEEALFSRPQITELARNPLMLAMIAVVVRQGKRLPKRRVELYDLTLKQLMTEWEYLRGEVRPALSIDYGEACQLWAPVARWMHEAGTGAVHEAELKQRLTRRLKELELTETAADWLAVRGDKCCLLQERGTNVFGFLHQTFQEYLAAMDLLRDGQFVPELDRYIEDPRWHEVLRLACGYLGVVAHPPQKANVTTLLRRILDHGSPYEHLLHRDLLLAASCIADDVKPRREIVQEIVTRLLHLAASGPMDSLAIEAMQMLVANNTVEVDEALLNEIEPVLVRHPAWEVHYRFLQWLQRRPGPARDPYLLQMSEDSDLDVRSLALALRWLQQREPELLGTALRSMASSSRDDVSSLFRQSPGPLIDYLRSGTPTGWEAAVEVLRGTHDFVEIVPHLVSLLQHEEPSVRVQAARLLRGTEAVSQAVPQLVSLLNHAEPSVRLQAARLLQETNAFTEVVPRLVSLMEHPEPEVRFEAAERLQGTDAFAQVVTQLVALLQCEEPSIRARAARMLQGTDALVQAVPQLVVLLQHANQDIRREVAVLATGKVEAELVNGLIAALQSILDPSEIEPGDLLYEAAFVYATLASRPGQTPASPEPP